MAAIWSLSTQVLHFASRKVRVSGTLTDDDPETGYVRGPYSVVGFADSGPNRAKIADAIYNKYKKEIDDEINHATVIADLEAAGITYLNNKGIYTGA